MLSKIIISMLFSVTAFAENSTICFTAANIDQMSIVTMDDERTIKATEATMRISPPNDQYTFNVMTMSIKGQGGEQIEIMGFDFNQTKGAEFRVECDGGGVQLKNSGERSLEANTAYIAGEIVNVNGEGCGMVRIAMKQVKFEQTTCLPE